MKGIVFFLTILLALTLAFVSCSRLAPSTKTETPTPPSPPIPMEQYIDEEHGFSIQVPAGWTPREPRISVELQAGMVVIWEDSEKTVAIAIAVRERQIASVNDVIAKARENERKTSGDWKLLESKVEKPERVWIWFQVADTKGVYLTILTKLKEFQILAAGEPAKHYLEQSMALEYSLSSFRLTR